MQFKPKKMKFLFKKYLEYETNHGTPESIEMVKDKANQYVQSLIQWFYYFIYNNIDIMIITYRSDHV